MVSHVKIIALYYLAGRTFAYRIGNTICIAMVTYDSTLWDHL